jgi:pantetheine-phosphate adenylyltransferase
MNYKAVYAGSFDPVTYGHLDIIARSSKLFSQLIVGVGNNPVKTYAFSLDERIRLLNLCVKEYKNVKVTPFDGLLIEFAKKNYCRVIVRGLRILTDFEYEFQIGLTNMDIESSIETIFLITNPKNIFISSSMVKEIVSNNGSVAKYVPKFVEEALIKKFQKKS